MLEVSVRIERRPAHRNLAAWGSMKDQLSRIALNRDEHAFRDLYEAYGGRLKSFMLRSGADPATAEELAQETLLQVWRKARLYDADKGSVASWIFTIARNLRIDRLRREVPWQELPDGMLEEMPDEVEKAPDDAVSERQHADHVRSALDSLSEEQREIITLAYIEGLSHSEIADKLAIPLGTVKSRIRLAYQKIRLSLETIR